jgi:2-polyprenyl-3-methyl-5-hydroxy-6-metoxy-1,4-benzoquinol methylase
VIPGYAGELLIKVAGERRETDTDSSVQTGSLALRDTYTTIYYTRDCGGYDAFARNGGKRLDDLRLQSVASIARLKQTGRVLDLGCGRGELAYYFARQGYTVTAIDYSEHAIALTESCFAGEEELRRRVQLRCASVCEVDLADAAYSYDLAIASDLIEHLSPAELELLYRRLSHWLKPDGLFIVHTFPNLWYYRYHYAARRRRADKLGAWLPLEPRSRYERLMHINEQSPRVLQRQLAQAFRHVHLWFADVTQPGGSLLRPYTIRELAAAPR